MDEFNALQKLPYLQVLPRHPKSVWMERAKAGFLAGQRESFFRPSAAPADLATEAGADWVEGVEPLKRGHSDGGGAGGRDTPCAVCRPVPPSASSEASTIPKAWGPVKMKKLWKKTPPTAEEEFELGPLPLHSVLTPPVAKEGGGHMGETRNEGSEQVI